MQALLRTFGLILVLIALALVTGAAGAETLGPGDAIRITVFQNPDLSLETRISERGTIAYPLLGEVALAGRSPEQAGERIASELRRRQFLRNPQVNVSLVELRSRQVSVLGEVANPGRYALEESSPRLTDVLALAGGISEAGGDEVMVIGKRDGKTRKQRVNVQGLIDGGGGAGDVQVRAGDTVYVPRAPVFYVYGEVRRAGAYRLEPGMRVMGALSLGGGLTERGTDRAPQVHRRMPDGTVQVYEARLTDSVLPGDVIYFRESLF